MRWYFLGARGDEGYTRSSLFSLRLNYVLEVSITKDSRSFTKTLHREAKTRRKTCEIPSDYCLPLPSYLPPTLERESRFCTYETTTLLPLFDCIFFSASSFRRLFGFFLIAPCKPRTRKIWKIWKIPIDSSEFWENPRIFYFYKFFESSDCHSII